jgi:hypothetical protein
MSRAASAADLVAEFGMTTRYWTRMAAEGKVPSAWQPSGGRGKWLFDMHAVTRWRQDKLRRVDQWQGHTGAGKRTGDVPSVTVSSTGSPSAPRIDALLKSAFGNG